MSAVVHSISEHPRLRIARLVELLRRHHEARVFLTARKHTEVESERIAYALDARLILHPETVPANVITDQRRKALLRTIRAEGGRWKSGRARRLYERLGYGHLGKGTASRDLLHLAAASHLIRHEADGVRYFTLAGDRDA
jgi:hypothetical protein